MFHVRCTYVQPHCLQELYCESYENVAVMFAAVSNFSDFWMAVPGNENGRGCLMILNEIIADFDELLGQPAFIEVEKIKTIGSTYMTCVGLSPLQKVSCTIRATNSWLSAFPLAVINICFGFSLRTTFGRI